MVTFLDDVATELVDRYGERLGELQIILPSKRARFFLTESFIKKVSQPSLCPQYLELSQIFEQFAQLHSVDSLSLLYPLYQAYKTVSYKENLDFNSFFPFGEMILSDFDTIDKYLIDARQLYTNLKNYKNIDAELSYLTPEQIDFLKEFWHVVEVNPENRLKKEFIGLWDMFFSIYTNFKEQLYEKQQGYQGMVQRCAIENLTNGKTALDPDIRYVAVGFNALTRCEQELFSKLQKSQMIDFFWDYDQYYVNNSIQEAGLFIRDNLKRFPSSSSMRHDYFSQTKNIKVISVPSDTLQAKYSNTILARYQDQKLASSDIAIVFSDENLLLPAIHAVPDTVENVNVTMGYPFHQTAVCQFIQLLLSLHTRKKFDSKIGFYYKDIEEFLAHPYLSTIFSEQKKIITESVFPFLGHYVSLPCYEDSILFKILNPSLLATDFCRELVDFLDNVTQLIEQPGPIESNLTLEGIRICNTIQILTQSFGDDLNFSVLQVLFRKVLRSCKIAFEGEPLCGVQMMGFLETRALDFKTVVILSANEGALPRHNLQLSFIPYKIALGFGLPTTEDREAVYAYYFYRLLQRAENIIILYSTLHSTSGSGEKSRYLLQLELESGKSITRTNLGLQISSDLVRPIEIEKTDLVMKKLSCYLGKNTQTLSATAINTYLTCPLSFYLKYVAGIRPPDNTILKIDDRVLGTVLHDVVAKLYSPHVSKILHAEDIETMKNSKIELKKLIGSSIATQFFKKKQLTEEEKKSVDFTFLTHAIYNYVRSLLSFHSTRTPFRMVAAELKIENVALSVPSNNDILEVNFTGTIDFIYEKEGTHYIADIKTGKFEKAKLKIDSIETPFLKAVEKHEYQEVIQTFLYALLYNTHYPVSRIAPELHFVRSFIGSEKPQTWIEIDKNQVEDVGNYLPDFKNYLIELLTQIYDSSIPFTQTANENACKYCDYNKLCRKQ